MDRDVVRSLVGQLDAPAAADSAMLRATEDLAVFRSRSIEQISQDIHQVLFTIAFQAGLASKEDLQMHITKCQCRICTLMPDFALPEAATGRFRDVEEALARGARLAFGHLARLSGCPPAPAPAQVLS